MAQLSLQEHLLRELNELYNHPKNGLIYIGKKVGIEILPPKKKVTVLLIGNHSAGKSSFINWYIEDNVQKTGMAIETQSFTVVASGRKRETLMGPASVFLFPHLKPLEKMEGVMDYLSSEISTSKKRQFSMITFVDTPGLVDGGMEYPYDVNSTILFLGGVADLIFVFFDPIGLALCKRTMSVVEKINSLYPEKLHFFLSKSDEIRKQTDKQKIMMQITQEVCRHSGLNRSGFTMPSIYIPPLARSLVLQNQDSGNLEESTGYQTGDCQNEIEEVCKQIDQTISRTLQIALHYFDKDITFALNSISSQLLSNKGVSERNRTCFLLASVTSMLCLGLLFSIGVHYGVDHYGLHVSCNSLHIQEEVVRALIVPVKIVISLLGVENKIQFYTGCFLMLLAVFAICRNKMCFKPTLPRRDVKELERLKTFILNDLMIKKVELTQQYIGESYDSSYSSVYT